MRLSSDQESKSEKAGSDCCLEKFDAVDENELSLNCVFEPLSNGVAEERANEAEDIGCVDKSTYDFKLDMGEKNMALEDEKESRNADVTLLPSDSMVEVSKENLIAPSPEKEIAKKGFAHDSVECVNVGFKEGREPAHVNLSLLEVGLKEEVKSSLVEKKSSVFVVKSFNETGNDVDVARGKIKVEETMAALIVDCKKEGNDSFNAINENADGALGVVKSKRGRKRKVVESSECTGNISPKKAKVEKDGVKVKCRVLRSRTMTMRGSVRADENRLDESVAGFKRQMEAECFDQSKLQKAVGESNQMTGRGRKKQKRRGRPPKIQGADCFKRKIKAECLDQTDLQIEVNESSQLTGRFVKKQKRRGRPPKVQGEELVLQENQKKEHKDTVIKNLKGRGRPPKLQAGNLSAKANEPNLKDIRLGPNNCNVQNSDRAFEIIGDNKKRVKISEESNDHATAEGTVKDHNTKQLNNNTGATAMNLKGRGRPPKLQAGNLSAKAKEPNLKDIRLGPNNCNVQNSDRAFEIIGDNKKTVKISEESNDHATAEGTVKDHNTKQLNNNVGGLERREIQQLVRDKIVRMVMKAGWTIEHRPRHQRQYLDAVYVDHKGRTHWSITKAYFSLKNKIEIDKATSEEVSAFTLIPDEELSVLFRSVSKVRCDKNKKKNKRDKDVCKADIVIKGEAQLKKKPGKKRKDGTKRKEIRNSAVKLANKSLNAKVKKDKSRHEHGVIVESSFQRRPKVSQKGRPSRKPCLVARSSPKGLDQDNDDCTIYTRKRNLLSWMIDSGVIIAGAKLQYGEGRKRSGLLEGTVTCDGIHCSCCNEVMEISNFVSHGGQKLDHSLKNIYIQSGGSSLLMCLLESWNKEVGSTNIRFNHVDVKGDDPNDDTCNICGDGGDLICCDACPSTFHQSCLDIQSFPSGEWHCIHCCCKFCGLVAGGTSQIDNSHHAPDFGNLTCGLCEEKFHYSCLQEEADANAGSIILPFCGRKCQETYIGVKFELKEGYSWTLLKRFEVSQDVSVLDDPMKVECNSKLAVAFSVMNECFVPIMDERSGVNRIHNVVYNCGSNFRRLNYSGFLTAILEKGGEVISAASIRIHGDRLAEMPFIGTRNMYRRQGMCRRLLDAIEHALGSLGVEKLVIPAIPELYKTWTNVFGFKPLEESTSQAMKGMCMIVFPGTDMLQKPLFKNQFADKNLSVVVADDKAVEYISAVKDGINLHMETNSPNAIDYEQRLATHVESETPTTSIHLPEAANATDSDIRSSSSDVALEHKVTGLINDSVKTSPLTSTVVPKNMFDLNLQPAAIDTDFQLIDDESISRDPQVCKSSFDLPESRAQVDNTTQPLVLV